jgi:hypothetical protein
VRAGCCKEAPTSNPLQATLGVLTLLAASALAISALLATQGAAMWPVWLFGGAAVAAAASLVFSRLAAGRHSHRAHHPHHAHEWPLVFDVDPDEPRGRKGDDARR